MNETKRRRAFLWCHAALLLCIPLFLLYRLAVGLLPTGMSGCFLHDFLFLYCPVCGGTRAVSALLRLDLLAAFGYNAFVVLLVFLFLIGDGIAWVRFLRHKSPYFRVPALCWVVLAVSLVLFWILRNYLMIAYGIDPTGDLGPLWRALLD